MVALSVVFHRGKLLNHVFDEFAIVLGKLHPIRSHGVYQLGHTGFVFREHATRRHRQFEINELFANHENTVTGPQTLVNKK